MGIKDLKFRLASQYLKPNTVQTEEGKGKKEVKTEKPEEIQQSQTTKEIGDKLLTEDPKTALMRDLGFVQVGKLNTSPEAVQARLTEYFTQAPEMAALNEMFGIENERPYNIRGVDNDKLEKYLAKGLSEESTNNISDFMDRLVSLS